MNCKKIDVYTDGITQKYLKKHFNYCFSNKKDYPAILKINKLKKNNIFNISKN